MAQSRFHPDELKKLKPGTRIWDRGVGYYRHKVGEGGTWLVRFRATMPDGSRLRVIERLPEARNRTDAAGALTTRKSEVFRGIWQPARLAPTNFAHFAETTFLEAKRAQRRRSVESYESDIKLHLVPFFGRAISLGAITRKQCRGFYEKRLKEVSPATAMNELACLRAIFSEAVHLELVTHNPATGIKRVAPNNARVRRITAVEIETLFAAAKQIEPIGELLLWVLYWTGMRIGEAVSMEWKNVSLEQKLIDLPKTKTGRPRAVPIRRELLSVLKTHREGAGEQRFVFPGPGEDVHATKDHMRGFWKRMVAIAGAKNIRPHDLRHHFAKRILDEGLEPRLVMRVMGWTSWQMLQRYVLASDDEVQEAIERLTLR